jgi:hypothetical protein
MRFMSRDSCHSMSCKTRYHTSGSISEHRADLQALSLVVEQQQPWGIVCAPGRT